MVVSLDSEFSIAVAAVLGWHLMRVWCLGAFEDHGSGGR